jgi:Fe-S cluster assembly scaffold protein SufB
VKKITVKKDEQRIIPLLWTGKETELEYTVTLAEPGASVNIQGLFLGNKEENLVAKITVVHAAPQTQSEVVIKSALTGRAKVDIHGLVKIEPGAKGTQTWLAAHLLLLSDKAKGLAIPSLEILENDVKAGHATTVGRLNDMELFYLMSRGLPRYAAKQLIVSGFLQDMINGFPKKMAKQATTYLEDLLSETEQK